LSHCPPLVPSKSNTRQQQHLALLGRQIGHGQRGATCGGGGVDPLGDAVADVRPDRVGHHPGVGALPPHLGAGVLAQQVPSDPVQPGGSVGMLGAILAAPPERQGERLGGKIIGQVGTDPPPQVAQDRRVVAVEQLGEAGRLDQRRGDQLGVVRRGSSGSGPVTQPIAEATRRVPLDLNPSVLRWRQPGRRAPGTTD
jgi:hypothetical protein